MKEVRDLIHFWESRRGESLALATLVAVNGSSYRRPGARMLISADGTSVGGISAGCIEEEVIAYARDVLRTGAPRLITFDTRLRFGCHGTIDILVEVLDEETVLELRDGYRHRQIVHLETIPTGNNAGTRVAGSTPHPDAFVHTIEPPLRLILLGDSSDSIALSHHATLLGWEVLHLDAAPVSVELLDDRTAVVIATHNFGRDAVALGELLPVGVKYLGLIGSRRRRDDLLFTLMQDGLPIRSNLFAPAGLHLGAESPEEIALSIVAEIQCVFRSGTAQQLRAHKAPVHQLTAESNSCVESAA